MRDLEVGRLLRLIRMRRGWRLIDLSGRCGLSTSALARTESGSFTSLVTVRRHAQALDLRVELGLVGRGAEVPRLLDSEHAAIVETLAQACRKSGRWAELEVDFREAGYRGRIDLLAFDQRSGDLAVVEVKTEVANIQEMLGSLATKVRLAPVVARRLGWASRRVVGVLALASTSRNRQLLAAHPATFEAFVTAPFRATGDPLATSHSRLLVWVAPVRAGRRRWLAGRRRVRSNRSAR